MTDTVDAVFNELKKQPEKAPIDNQIWYHMITCTTSKILESRSFMDRFQADNLLTKSASESTVLSQTVVHVNLLLKVSTMSDGSFD